MIRMFTKSDKGVSPVIGVILMVAITVILAAVIGAFVISLGGDVNEEVNAGVTVDENDGDVTVRYHSEGTAEQLRVEHNGSQVATLDSVGDSVTVLTNSGDTVTVVGQSGSNNSVISSTTSSETSQAVSDGNASAGTLESSETTTTAVLDDNTSQTLQPGQSYTTPTFAQEAETAETSSDKYDVTITGESLTQAPDTQVILRDQDGDGGEIDSFDSQSSSEITFSTPLTRTASGRSVEIEITNNTTQDITIDSVTVEETK